MYRSDTSDYFAKRKYISSRSNVTGDKEQFYTRDDGCNLETLALFDKL